MLDIAVLIIGAPYVGYAGVVYWRLRTSSELQAEIVATRSWVRCTPPLHLFASLLVPAMPLIAELASVINGLLRPVEMITRRWRSREAG